MQTAKLLLCFALACTVVMDDGASGAQASDSDDSAPQYQSRVAGRLDARFLGGISGLVASRRQPGVLWIHNDFAKQPFFYAIDTHARLLATHRLLRVKAVNYEDIALGPGPQPGTDYLYVGDIGDNLCKRPEITVYRLPEPIVHIDRGRDLTTHEIVDVEALRFVYPGGARYDAETIMADPASGDLFIITRELSLRARIFRSRAPQDPGRQRVLEDVGSVETGSPVTAGDISARGDRIVLRTYFHALLWSRPPGASIVKVLQAPARSIPILAEPQGEAIGFDPASSGFYTLSEGANPPLYFFSPLPRPKANSKANSPARD